MRFIHYTFLLLALSCTPAHENTGSALPDQAQVISHVKVLDFNTGAFLKNQHVYFRQGHIDSISSVSPDPAVFRVIDGTDKFLIPGLIDMHVHATAGPVERMLAQLKKSLQGGVTTVRDMGGDMIAVKSWLKDSAVASVIPDIRFSAIFAGSTWIQNDPRAAGSAHGMETGKTPWLNEVNAQTDFKAAIAAAKDFGVTGIKLYADIPPALLNALVTEARSAGLKVWSHATLYPVGPGEVIAAGVHSVSHAEILLYALKEQIPPTYHSARFLAQQYSASQVNSAPFQALLKTMAEKDTYLDATLFVTEKRAALMGDNQLQIAEMTYLATKLAHQHGVKIIAGTDALMDEGEELPNIHKELQLLVNESGLSPLEALKAATLHAGVLLGTTGLGKLSKGFQADMILLNSNPLEVINNTEDIFQVYKMGKLVR